MKLGHDSGRIFVLGSTELATALARTTHLGIGAHADDLEIMAGHGILACRGQADRWFSGLIVGSGTGGPRAAAYATLSEQEMAELRTQEQRRAAELAEFSYLAMLGYPSERVKAGDPAVVDDLRRLLAATSPEVVYTHNLADKHDTHVAVALRVLAACRSLPVEQRPARVLGCEVWRDLDWLCDADKLRLPVDGDEAWLTSLLAAHASQLASGKRYDLATLGRQRAHATFDQSHQAADANALSLAMDLTPLIHSGDPVALARELIERFQRDVLERLARLG